MVAHRSIRCSFVSLDREQHNLRVTDRDHYDAWAGHGSVGCSELLLDIETVAFTPLDDRLHEHTAPTEDKDDQRSISIDTWNMKRNRSNIPALK